MRAETRENTFTTETWSVIHALSPEDSAAMTTLRSGIAAMKGKLEGVSARGPFNGIMERVAVPGGVTFEADTVGDIYGWWAKPAQAIKGAAILHLHGGWFNWGTAQAFRNLVGHIATAGGSDAFIPDYRLAPEHPFPAAPEDVRATYFGLIERGFTKVAVTGDSAGGNLALGLLGFLKTSSASAMSAIVGSVALSPITDLSLTGRSWLTRAVADPYFTQPQVTELVRSYLNGHDAFDPLASPLNADLAGFPPLRVHVGDDEVLLGDSVRFVEQAVAAGVDARVDVWEGMVHGFLGAVGRLEAATESLNLIGKFLAERFAAAPSSERQRVNA